MKRIAMFGMVVIAAASVTACGSLAGPDEFRVVRKAPLTIPPEYNLRPPQLGQTRPQELAPETQARVAVFGVDVGAGASTGEKLFIKAAGGDATERTIRNAVDFDANQILHKNRSFADMILNWGGDGGGAKEPIIDPAAEQERLRAQQATLKEVTGDAPVVLQPRATSKLPGL